MRSASIFKVARAAKPAALGLVIGISLSRFAFFMVAPFLAVILNQRFGMPIAEIGLLFTLSGLLGLAAAPLGGMMADRLGLFWLILFSSGIVALGYLVMMLFPNRMVFVVSILVSAFASGILEPLLRSVLGDSATSDEDRAGLHHLRYFGVNVAGATGPLIGAWFITHESAVVFGIAALGMVILGFTALRALRAIPVQNHAGEGGASMRLALRHMLANKLFVALFLSNFLLVFIYAQTEEPLTFLMLDMGVEGIPRIIAIMSMINAVTVLLVHGAIMHWIVGLSEVRAIRLAAISFALALGLIAVNQSGNEYIWFAAIFISTFGELIAMPLFLTIIDKVAPARHRNSYFGIYILSNLGGVMVPLLAGALLTLVGGTAIFVVAALLCLPLGIVGARVLANASAPQTTGEQKP